MNSSHITPKHVKKKNNETWSNKRKRRRSFNPIQMGTMILFYTSNKNFSLHSRTHLIPLLTLWIYLDRTYFAEIENLKHCSKIIFKCVNSAVRLIFNEKVAKNWNLWVHEQCTDALFTVKKSTFAATVQWTIAALLQNAWKQKKNKKKRTKTQLVKRRRSFSGIQTDT